MKVKVGAELSDYDTLAAAGLFAILLRAIEEGKFTEASRTRSKLAALGITVEFPRKPDARKRGTRS